VYVLSVPPANEEAGAVTGLSTRLVWCRAVQNPATPAPTATVCHKPTHVIVTYTPGRFMGDEEAARNADLALRRLAQRR
jgi:hypothetical protein